MGHDEASRIHRRKMSEGREGRKARMGGDPFGASNCFAVMWNNKT